MGVLVTKLTIDQGQSAPFLAEGCPSRKTLHRKRCISEGQAQQGGRWSLLEPQAHPRLRRERGQQKNPVENSCERPATCLLHRCKDSILLGVGKRHSHFNHHPYRKHELWRGPVLGLWPMAQIASSERTFTAEKARVRGNIGTGPER